MTVTFAGKCYLKRITVVLTAAITLLSTYVQGRSQKSVLGRYKILILTVSQYVIRTDVIVTP